LLSVKLVFWIADCFFAESRSGIFFFFCWIMIDRLTRVTIDDGCDSHSLPSKIKKLNFFLSKKLKNIKKQFYERSIFCCKFVKTFCLKIKYCDWIFFQNSTRICNKSVFFLLNIIASETNAIMAPNETKKFPFNKNSNFKRKCKSNCFNFIRVYFVM